MRIIVEEPLRLETSVQELYKSKWLNIYKLLRLILYKINENDFVV